MAYVDALYKTNFLEYASYVIKDRAIPHIDDGLKPVQRRILHSMFEMDDGKFNKVANVVGHCMKYHPHGDASIYSALVVLANKDMFIDKQGNFGNIFTGDPPSAARYIECRVTPMAKETLYNPELTQFEDSYDSRNREPVVFPAKIPVLLALGTEGIAVGMATKILPHNLIELMEAQIACLEGREFSIYPDFPTGGIMDASEYNGGNGKVRVRARLDVTDPKRILIREIPFGSSTESLIASIEAAAKKGTIKISGISDFTSDQVEIEVKLARGVHAEETVDALHAFTECESTIHANLMVIMDEKPRTMTATSVIRHNTERLVGILEKELILERGHLNNRLHALTLEQIFIENRVYKAIEKMDTPEKIVQAVLDGLAAFASDIKREVTVEDVETLLKIPIRKISLYDINKAKKEMKEMLDRLKVIKSCLANLTGYAIDFLKGLVKKYGPQYPRKTEIISFEKVSVREAAKRDMKLRYDREMGYLGTKVNGNVVLEVSPYDRVLVIRKNGDYSVVDVEEKLFVDTGMRFCGFVEKERVYNVLYRDRKTGYPYIKRCNIEKYILNKGYSLIPEDCVLLDLTTESEESIMLNYKPKPRLRVLQESFKTSDFPIRGAKAGGIRLAKRETRAGKFGKAGEGA
ncbi:MAG: DNA topoisomerase IV subunit A [Nitrospinae bacterium]|nr:DNA topoisomerase IV subunit A [Nitrospinota bacterium]